LEHSGNLGKSKVPSPSGESFGFERRSERLKIERLKVERLIWCPLDPAQGK
jgi:hypothetical protein